MQRYILILFFSSAFSLAGLSQQYIEGLKIDSLKKVILSLRNAERIDCLNALSEAYTYLQTDTAKRYALNAYTEASNIGYFRGMARSFRNQGFIEGKALGHFLLAEEYGRKAIELYKKANDNKGLVDAYLIWSFALYAQGLYDSSVNGNMKAIQLCQKINYKVMEARANTMIALIYMDCGNYSKAFEYSMEGLKVAMQSKDPDRITVALAAAGNLYGYAGDTKLALTYYFESLRYAKGNILFVHPLLDLGDIHYSQKQYDSALYYYNRLIDTIESRTTDPAVRHGASMNAMTGIGEVTLAKKAYGKALVYFKEVLNYSEKANDQNQVMRVLLDIARTFYGKKDYKAALYHAQRCLWIAGKLRPKQYLRDGNQLMFLIYDQLKRTDSAYIYYRRYMDMKDSVALEVFNRKLDLYKVVAEDEKKLTRIKVLSSEKLINQQQLKLQQQRLKSESLWKNILIASIFILLLFGLILFRYNILKRRNEKLQMENTLQLQQLESEKTKAELQQQTTQLEMRALRAQMNPHFIFNCLSSINRFILINKIDEASDYLTKFSRLIRMALHNSEKSLITLESELEALRLYLDLERLRFKNAFTYTITFINTIDVNTVYIPPMLIQPFAENAIWHGLMHKKDIGCLDIQLCAKDKTFVCTITDNGVGRNMAAAVNTRSAEKYKSMGVEITTGRLALLNKSKNEATVFTIEDMVDEEGKGCGTKVVLTMPYKDLTDVVA